MSEAVWTNLDIDVELYHEDLWGELISGAVSGAPVIKYLFLESASLNAEAKLARRPVTGRPQKRIITEETYEYTLEVKHLYFSGSDEFDVDDIFCNVAQPSRRLRMLMKFVNPQTDSQETHTLFAALPASFRLETEGGAVDSPVSLSHGSATFWAERYE